MVAERCELGGRFRRCSNPPADTCQYCGRSICRDHAYFLEGYDAVCKRPVCTAKHDELPSHQEYVRGVLLRNREGLCGLDGCTRPLSYDCSKCRGRFCLGHLSDELYPAANSNEGPQMAVVCAHCWERRKIWGKS